ncbi:hypothetical protein ACFO0N_05550 [Halobium salinum]|uniref:Uncharacterized protein n=1 Tax=Halobium salinum TaxID=1364940 RepID=A0ABD5P950_9EURY|nr:hypothetical protein [Halobium salinum]
MDWSLFGRYFLWYGVGAGAVVAVVLLGTASVAGFPLGLAATVLFLGSSAVAAALFGTSDTGIETASSGALVGFGSSNPMDFQPESLPGFDRAAVACLFLGTALYGGVVVAVLLAG